MNLYLISQSANLGYDTYDCAVVAAETEDIARSIHPASADALLDDKAYIAAKAYDAIETASYRRRAWVDDPLLVKVRLIGVAAEGTKQGVIVASFNAG